MQILTDYKQVDGSIRFQMSVIVKIDTSSAAVLSTLCKSHVFQKQVRAIGMWMFVAFSVPGICDTGFIGW